MSYEFLKDLDAGYSKGKEDMKQKAMEAFRVMGEETCFDIPTDVLMKAREIFKRELNS